MATSSTAPRVFEPAGDPVPAVGGSGPLFWRRIPEVLASEPGIGPMDAWVFLQFLCAIGPRDFSGSVPQKTLAERARVSERTIRSSLAKLTGLGFLTVERERVGAVNTIRLAFDYRAVLVLQPEAPIATGSGVRKRRGQRQQAAAIHGSEQRQPVAAGQRQQAAATPLLSRECLERTTTTSCPDPAGGGAGEVDDPSSSFSLHREEGTEPEGPSEAPGPPQGDRREESAESPGPAAPAPPWAARAVERAAESWPDAPADRRESWLRRLQHEWRGLGREADGAPPRFEECLRVGALALEYAALKRPAIKNPADPVAYLVPALRTWSASGLTSAEIEAEVGALRPRPRPAAAVEAPTRAPREEPPEEVRKARRDYLRTVVRDPARAEEALRRLRELEAAWRAGKKDRPAGVSACPPAGSEL